MTITMKDWANCIRQLADNVEADEKLTVSSVDILKDVLVCVTDEYEIDGKTFSITIRGWNDVVLLERIEQARKEHAEKEKEEKEKQANE